MHRTSFDDLFPLMNMQGSSEFHGCLTLKDFLLRSIDLYFHSTEPRVREASLSVYMAFRDHYPSYLEGLDQERVEKMNFDIIQANPKIIKLRRLVISAIAKVAA